MLQTLRELSLLLHHLDYGTGYAPAHGSNDGDSAAAPPPAAAAAEEEEEQEQEADSADIPQDPVERMAKLVLQHNHMMVSVVVAGRNHVLAGFTLVNPETGKARKEHDQERYKWAIQQIKLKPDQVSDIVGVMKVFHRLYTPVAAQLSQLQLQLGLQPAGTTGAGAAANGSSFVPGSSTSSSSTAVLARSSSSSGSGSTGCTESEVQPPSSMLKHLEESESKAQKLQRLNVLLRKDAMIKMGVGMLLASAIELPQLARLMVLMNYPLNMATFGIVVTEMHKHKILQLGQQQQQQGQHRHARRQQQQHATVLSKKRVLLVRKKLEACNLEDFDSF
jgi:hypothetical protein